jgi:hypothetical protein
MIACGHVQNGVIVLDDGVCLPEGQKVTVTAVAPIPAAEQRYYVSPERREALLRLIGIWKTESPPNDEEVERIIEEYRMKKYG